MPLAQKASVLSDTDTLYYGSPCSTEVFIPVDSIHSWLFVYRLMLWPEGMTLYIQETPVRSVRNKNTTTRLVRFYQVALLYQITEKSVFYGFLWLVSVYGKKRFMVESTDFFLLSSATTGYGKKTIFGRIYEFFRTEFGYYPPPPRL